MPLYRLINQDRKMISFYPTELGKHYLEQHLENWLEANPQVLIGDEPLLIIGRQVKADDQKIDLLALNAEGTGMIIELKRAPDQRTVIAQALEYTAWLAEQGADRIQKIYTDYCTAHPGMKPLEEAWKDTFNTDLSSVKLNERQCILVAIEGQNERLKAVARFLRKSGLDIHLVTYNYFRTEGGEEILDIEKQVGGEEIMEGARPGTRPNEEQVLNVWTPEVRSAYLALRDLMTGNRLLVQPKKAGISFYKQAREGLVFICFVAASATELNVWLRADSLQLRFDFNASAEKMRAALNRPGFRIKSKPVWFLIDLTATPDNACLVGRLVLDEVALKIA